EGKVVAQGHPHELAAQQMGPTRVEMRFADNDPELGTRLEDSPEVSEVTPGRVPGSWIVGVDVGHLPDTIREVAAIAPLVGVHRLDDDLDAIYRRYFDTTQEVAE